MPATLLVLDIDGTLRPHGEPRVPKENVDALRTVQKAGVKLVIATGRCRAEIPAKMLRGIRPDYWICAAGAQVEDAAGTALYTSHMTAEEMYALVDFCEDYEHPLGFSFSDGGYVYLDYEAFHVQEKAAALEGCLKDGEDQDRHLLDMPFSAFGMLAAEDIAKFQAKYGYLGLQFLPYHVTGCDILRAGQDKATGLQALLDHLGLAAADCVAVGDGPNDAGMLALAGHSYCMADGMKTAKAAAKALAHPMALPSCAAVCGRRYSVEHQTTVHPCGAGAAPTVRRTGQSADLRQLSQPKEPGTRVLLRPPAESVLAADGCPDPQPHPRMGGSGCQTRHHHWQRAGGVGCHPRLLYPRGIGCFHQRCGTE